MIDKTMAKHRLCDELRDASRWFRRERGGNMAITLALALIPVVGLVGASVDYSRANSIRAAMQGALDSTALMLGKNSSLSTLTSSQLQQAATSYFTAVFNSPEAKNVVVTPAYSAAGPTVTVSGSATINTDILGVLGIKQINISTASTVTLGMTKLRVALVLDNTGSMSQSGKLSALQTASHQLLQQFQNAALTPGDVQVAIVPFTTDVNIGTANASQWWIDWSLWSTSSTTSYTSGGTYCINGWSWNGTSLSYVGTCPSTTSSSTTSHGTWTGCVMDRGTSTAPAPGTQANDVQNTAPVNGTVATYFPADPSPPLGGCPVQLMPLSTDWTALNNKIDTMVANGETNQAIGLAWGWLALTSGLPLNAPALASGTQQVIILLTDGMNTADRWYNVFSGGASCSLSGGSVGCIDDRTKLLCTNIKQQGITIYTVLVNTDGQSTANGKQLLQNCASDSSKYFELTASGQMVTTFNQIGTHLSKLRIAK